MFKRIIQLLKLPSCYQAQMESYYQDSPLLAVSMVG